MSGLRTVSGGGRLLRGSDFTTTGRHGLLLLAGGLTQAARAGHGASMLLVTLLAMVGQKVDAGGEPGSLDEWALRAVLGAGPGFSLPLVGQSSRLDWTGSRGPVRETRGAGPRTLPADGGSGRSDGTGSRGPLRETEGLALTPCPLVGRTGRWDWTGSRGPLRETGGGGVGSGKA